MAELDENKSGVFGGVEFEEKDKGISNPYFEEPVSEEKEEQASSGAAGNVFGNFGMGTESSNFQPIEKEKAITKQGLWTRIKAFLFKEIDLNAPIKVELTPYQQKVEDEINEFLHQEITFKGIANFFRGSK